MWVLGDADHILLVHIEGSLQLASGSGEAVEDEVLAHTIHPLAPGGERAADEVPAVPLTGGEGPHDLALHVHDDHTVGPVADHHLVHVPGHHVDTVDVDIAPGRAAQGLECVLTLRGLCVPDLDSSVTRGAAMKFSSEKLLKNIYVRP